MTLRVGSIRDPERKKSCPFGLLEAIRHVKALLVRNDRQGLGMKREEIDRLAAASEDDGTSADQAEHCTAWLWHGGPADGSESGSVRAWVSNRVNLKFVST